MIKEKTIIGFIGTGVMGNSMSRHILDAGFQLIVYTRSKEKAQDLLENGAKWAVSPEELAQQADVIISMVGYPKDVEEIYLGEKGILKDTGRTKYVIDMTTSTPSLAVKIYEKALDAGVKALDAPVSGGDIGARERKLTIMAGGSKDDFEDIRSILEIFGTNIIYQGEAGAGQHTKMCNQIAIASNMIGVAEAVVYAKKAGLDPERVLQSISAGAAGSWSLSNLAPRMIKGDFAPGFYIKHFIKDMGIALEEAEKMQMDVPGLKLAKSLYEELAEAGEESSGTQAILKHWSY
ncbi:NAD(P)-dependent oxidoreductase [Peribacillus psychrosaccharolyticus]|uniref:NAD(P)-dependent oxidoreductase n=2 Tax=Peribacillus psychrosaccharolyticus TaxID=1407 RepID=A0A974NRL1_PERPY|nr:NAD(P)-dependent oxidoreductase [Peribacillus psychrosaccharolyticus]MEC2057571.1 NAD(P)-dependent oxidoreductase [Peribacillus psychrosaccharolyticus]MED3746027.1 NAD(P)-dependent oxidoreductase [Peribacillus psychrosaccharolyticus]QQT02579.1 NAD(P)-dependent oxidoreductase [Peribacillus psychrosaccharolyticus]